MYSFLTSVFAYSEYFDLGLGLGIDAADLDRKAG